MESRTDKPSVVLRYGSPALRFDWGRYSLAALGVLALLGQTAANARNRGLGSALAILGVILIFGLLLVAFDYRHQMKSIRVMCDARDAEFAILTKGNFESLVRGIRQDAEVEWPRQSLPVRRMILFLTIDGPRLEVVGAGRKPVAGWVQFPANTEVTLWRSGDELKAVELSIGATVKSLRAKGSIDLPNSDAVNWIMN